MNSPTNIHFLIVEDWLPTSVNLLLQTHPMHRAKLKKRDAEVVGVAALQQAIPRASGKRRLFITLAQCRGRSPDPDNVLKSLLDGLVKCGLLLDDAPNCCEIDKIAVLRGPRKMTYVTLQDC